MQVGLTLSTMIGFVVFGRDSLIEGTEWETVPGNNEKGHTRSGILRHTATSQIDQNAIDVWQDHIFFQCKRQLYKDFNRDTFQSIQQISSKLVRRGPLRRPRFRIRQRR